MDLRILRDDVPRLADSKNWIAGIYEFEAAAHRTALWICPWAILSQDPYTSILQHLLREKGGWNYAYYL